MVALQQYGIMLQQEQDEKIKEKIQKKITKYQRKLEECSHAMNSDFWKLTADRSKSLRGSIEEDEQRRENIKRMEMELRELIREEEENQLIFQQQKRELEEQLSKMTVESGDLKQELQKINKEMTVLSKVVDERVTDFKTIQIQFSGLMHGHNTKIENTQTFLEQMSVRIKKLKIEEAKVKVESKEDEKKESLIKKLRDSEVKSRTGALQKLNSLKKIFGQKMKNLMAEEFTLLQELNDISAKMPDIHDEEEAAKKEKQAMLKELQRLKKPSLTDAECGQLLDFIQKAKAISVKKLVMKVFEEKCAQRCVVKMVGTQMKAKVSGDKEFKKVAVSSVDKERPHNYKLEEDGVFVRVGASWKRCATLTPTQKGAALVLGNPIPSLLQVLHEKLQFIQDDDNQSLLEMKGALTTYYQMKYPLTMKQRTTFNQAIQELKVKGANIKEIKDLRIAYELAPKMVLNCRMQFNSKKNKLYVVYEEEDKQQMRSEFESDKNQFGFKVMDKAIMHRPHEEEIWKKCGELTEVEQLYVQMVKTYRTLSVEKAKLLIKQMEAALSVTPLPEWKQIVYCNWISKLLGMIDKEVQKQRGDKNMPGAGWSTMLSTIHDTLAAGFNRHCLSIRKSPPLEYRKKEKCTVTIQQGKVFVVLQGQTQKYQVSFRDHPKFVVRLPNLLLREGGKEQQCATINQVIEKQLRNILNKQMAQLFQKILESEKPEEKCPEFQRETSELRRAVERSGRQFKAIQNWNAIVVIFNDRCFANKPLEFLKMKNEMPLSKEVTAKLALECSLEVKEERLFVKWKGKQQLLSFRSEESKVFRVTGERVVKRYSEKKKRWKTCLVANEKQAKLLEEEKGVFDQKKPLTPANALTKIFALYKTPTGDWKKISLTTCTEIKRILTQNQAESSFFLNYLTWIFNYHCAHQWKFDHFTLKELVCEIKVNGAYFYCSFIGDTQQLIKLQFQISKQLLMRSTMPVFRLGNKAVEYFIGEWFHCHTFTEEQALVAARVKSIKSKFQWLLVHLSLILGHKQMLQLEKTMNQIKRDLDEKHCPAIVEFAKVNILSKVTELQPLEMVHIHDLMAYSREKCPAQAAQLQFDFSKLPGKFGALITAYVKRLRTTHAAALRILRALQGRVDALIKQQAEQWTKYEEIASKINNLKKMFYQAQQKRKSQIQSEASMTENNGKMLADFTLKEWALEQAHDNTLRGMKQQLRQIQEEEAKITKQIQNQMTTLHILRKNQRQIVQKKQDELINIGSRMVLFKDREEEDEEKLSEKSELELMKVLNLPVLTKEVAQMIRLNEVLSQIEKLKKLKKSSGAKSIESTMMLQFSGMKSTFLNSIQSERGPFSLEMCKALSNKINALPSLQQMNAASGQLLVEIRIIYLTQCYTRFFSLTLPN